MGARLVLDDVPGAWTTFTTGGKSYRARMDPLWLGADKLPRLLEDTRLVWQLLDDRSRLRAMTSDMFGSRTVIMLRDYADHVGLGFDGLAAVVRGLEHLDDLEVDLVRMGVEIRDWLDLDGPLSSRRMSLLIRDLEERPETRMGAVRTDLFPLDKSALVLAQIAASMAKGSEKHSFLKSRSELRAEAEAKAERDAAVERMRKRW